MKIKKKRNKTIQYSSRFSTPVHAFLIQAIAFFLTLGFTYLVLLRVSIQANLFLLACLQGTIAVVISYWRKLPIWWLPIQFVFFPILFIVHYFELPSFLFFIGFLMLLFIYWGVVITRVPLYLSSHALWKEMIKLLPANRPVRFIDIGSGIGGLILYLSKTRTESTFHGVEISPLPWLISRVRQFFSNSKCTFIYGNYERIALTEYDVAFAYLSPVAMDAVFAKVKKEMRPGSLFFSYEFPVFDVKPDMLLLIGNSKLYGWYI